MYTRLQAYTSLYHQPICYVRNVEGIIQIYAHQEVRRTKKTRTASSVELLLRKFWGSICVRLYIHVCTNINLLEMLEVGAVADFYLILGKQMAAVWGKNVTCVVAVWWCSEIGRAHV